MLAIRSFFILVVSSLCLVFSFTVKADSSTGKVIKVQTNGDGGFFIKLNQSDVTNTCLHGGVYISTPHMTEATVKNALSMSLLALSAKNDLIVYYDIINDRCYGTVLSLNAN